MGVPSVSDVLSIPTRWGGVTNGANGIAQYFAQQQQAKQNMQMGIAQDLAKARIDAWSKQQDPIARALTMGKLGEMGFPIGSIGQGNGIDDLMQGNPYAKWAFPNGSSGSQQNSSPSPLMGGGAMPSSSPGMVSPNGFNPVSRATSPDNSGLVQTEVNMSPFGTQLPAKFTNIPAVAAVKSAETYAGEKGKQTAGAQESETRDIQQLAMVRNAVKPLVDSYNQVYNSKDMGFLPAGGDKFGSFITEHAGNIPRWGGLQNAMVPPETQKAAGQFLANKNELVTKLQPLLSQQFGKEGSSRIMENLVKMSQQEIGDLGTPRDQFHGQITGTLSSLYRIAKASQAYAKDLSQSGQQTPDPDVASQEIAKRMSMQDLSPKESKELQGMIDDVLGKNELPKTGADLNPLKQSANKKAASTITPSPKSEGNTLDMKTAQGLLQAAGGDKNKARQLAKNMGYSL